jgi:transcriptional regulator with XRE-family HTH domain
MSMTRLTELQAMAELDASKPRFGRILARHRHRLGMSQPELARRIDCDHSFISRLERGEREPSRSMLMRMAELFRLGEKENSELFSAAGFLPPGRVIVSLPVLVEIEDALNNPDISPEFKLVVRMQLSAISGGLATLAKMNEGKAA